MIGTSPIEFEVVEVEATEGGNAELFRHLVNVRGGGRMEFPLISDITPGRYRVSLRVFNEGYSHIVKDVFTFIGEIVMRQIILIGLIAIVLLPGSNTMGQGIQFMQGSYREVLEKAKAENKKVFIDFYTTWCGPCKEMSSKVFTDADVAKYFNEKFISYQINAEDKAFRDGSFPV